MHRTRFLTLIGGYLLLSGCVWFCGPASWAERLEAKVQCGMSPQQVEQLANHQIVKMDAPTAWGTHLIRDGTTDVWLVYADDKLQSVQVAWTYTYGKVLFGQPVKLCQASPR